MAALFILLLVFSLKWSESSAAMAYPPALRKLDPLLKSLYFKRELRAAPGLLQHIRHGEPEVINAIVKFSGSPGAIESTGARVRSIIGDIVTADIPVSALSDLVDLPDVIYIQAARIMQPALLDISVPDTRADQVWQSTPGYTGKGVIVGIIDEGVDWQHPDFKGNDGTSRILYIWDQIVQTPGQYPGGYRYGTEWTKAQIDSGQCQVMDATSHGTHTASTIAGNSRGADKFTGMAPEADIIAVKTGFEDADILDAAYYIFQKASELKMPAVINMSFGSHWGPHDGTDLMDRAMNAMLGSPGRVIAASAGNDGSYPIHAGTTALRQPVGNDYPWMAIEPSVGSRSIVAQLWYHPASSLSVRLLLPENESGTPSDLGLGWVPEGQYREFTVPNGPVAGARVLIDFQPASEFLYPNFDSIFISIEDDGDLNIPIDEFKYAIECDGFGTRLDAYVPYEGSFLTKSSEFGSYLNSSFFLAGNGNNSIISPASAAEVICVGSYVTRDEWIDSENRLRTDSSSSIDNISAFSSLGPLLNGFKKPDIAAPGEMIVAAFSSESWSRARSIYRDGIHAAFRGTSMSSPHVAGAAALIYQQNPSLTASEVKDMLINGAVDRGPAGWDRVWGYGKLDVLSAMGIPSMPQDVRATFEAGFLTLKWLPNPESDIAGYRVYLTMDDRSLITDLPISNIQSQTPGIQYQASSTRYRVSVSAYDSNGNESPRSPQVTIISETPGPDVIPPDPPADVNVISIDKGLEITWSRNSEYDLGGYVVYYGTSSGNYDRKITVGDLNKCRIENLINGVRVYIAISAIDTSGNESGKSPEVSEIPQLFPRPGIRYQGGWPVSVDHDLYSSPALYDFDGDGRLEVSISARDGKVYLVGYNGRHIAGWPVSTGSASVSSPALADVDADGHAEIVVGAGEMLYMWHDNGLQVRGWPVRTDGSIIAAPALGDINGDGKIEVVAGSWDGNVYAYNSDGSLLDGWPVAVDGHVYSSAALGDIDGDSGLEIVVGSEGGSMYTFNGDGTIAAGWPVYIKSAIYSSPALGDIDGDGDMEIVVADERGRVYAWHSDGKIAKGWPVDLQVIITSSPALGDIDDDKKTLEIAICTRYGSLYVLKSNGAIMSGWPVSVMSIVDSSPALGDIDDDGKLDVVISTSTGLLYIGLVYAFTNAGKRLNSTWPLYTEGNICYSSPALGDLDGDGDVELVVGSCRQGDGTGGRIHAWDLAGRPTSEMIAWGGFRHDTQRTGVADDRLPPSFVIAALQNAALKKYWNLYTVASEKLTGAPELTIEFAPDADQDKLIISSMPLIEVDAGVYQAHLVMESEGLYTFTVRGTDKSGNAGYSSKTVSIQLYENDQNMPLPVKFSLLPNYPNPFNPGTWIPYELAKPAYVSIDIYNTTGQLIRSLSVGHQTAGSYTNKHIAAYWDGRDDSLQEAASGVYFCILKAGDFEAARKMILLR